MRTVSLTLAALISAAVALPLDPAYITSHPDSIPIQDAKYHHRRQPHADYVEASLAIALCETVNGLTKIIQSSDIGPGAALGLLKCNKLPRVSKREVCSSSSHSSKSSHDHDNHDKSHHDEGSHQHGSNSHSHGGHHQEYDDKGEVFDGHGSIHAVHPHDPSKPLYSTPPTNPVPDPASIYQPLLDIDIDGSILDDTLDDILRAVPLTPLDTDSIKHAAESVTGSDLNSSVPVVEEKAENLTHTTLDKSLSSGSLDGAADTAGSLIHLALHNGNGISDIPESVNGAAVPVGGLIETGSGVVSGNPANAVTDVTKSSAGGLVHAAVLKDATSEPVGLVHALKGTESVTSSAAGPLAHIGAPAGGLLHATVNDTQDSTKAAVIGTVNKTVGDSGNEVKVVNGIAQNDIAPVTNSVAHNPDGGLARATVTEGNHGINADDAHAADILNGVVLHGSQDKPNAMHIGSLGL